MAGEYLALSAPAKINLYLKITGRREDGYHYLKTLMQKISLADSLLLKKKDSGILLNCPESSLPTGEANLVYKAAQLFFNRMKQVDSIGNPGGVEIVLKKTIPIAAGLGGGSSDAGAALRGLNQLYANPFSAHELLAMAASLGADVPQFITDWPVVWATGIGEQLHPAVPLQKMKILLVTPDISVSTRWVYENFALTGGENINNLKNSQKESAIDNWGVAFAVRPIRPDELENDLEHVTAGRYEIIDMLKKRMLQMGADAAMMSGSGPTVFGLFADRRRENAVLCYQELLGEFKNTYLVDPLQ